MPENKERKLNPKEAVGKANQPTVQNYHRFRDQKHQRPVEVEVKEKRNKRRTVNRGTKAIQRGKKKSLQQNGTGTTEHSHAKEWYFTPHTKINFKRI